MYVCRLCTAPRKRATSSPSLGAKNISLISMPCSPNHLAERFLHLGIAHYPGEIGKPWGNHGETMGQWMITWQSMGNLWLITNDSKSMG